MQEKKENKKIRILVNVPGLLPPAIKMAGLRIIYELQKEINKDKDIEIYILTSIFRFVDKNYLDWIEKQREKEDINIFIINDKVYENTIFEFLKSKLNFLWKAYKLDKKYNFDIIHDYSSAPIIFLFSIFYKKLMRKTVFHTLCTSNKGRLGSFRFNWGIRWVDRVICASRFIADELTKEVSDRYRNKICYIPLGVDSQRFIEQGKSNFLRQILKISDDNNIVLFIGPFEERKGAPVLAKAAGIVLENTDKARFVFVSYGEGGLDRHHKENKNKFLEIIKDFKDDIYILEGVYNIPSLLASSDIFVLSSITSHGILAQPLTLLEAMSAGKPIVASNIDGVEEVIKDGYNGLLFEDKNIRDLADKICRLIKDDNYGLSLGYNAKKDIIQNYDIKISANKVIDNYGKFIR